MCRPYRRAQKNTTLEIANILKHQTNKFSALMLSLLFESNYTSSWLVQTAPWIFNATFKCAPVIIFYNKKVHNVRPVEGQNINFQTVFANFLIFFQTLEKFSEQNSSNFFHFYYTKRATIYTSEFVFATSQSEFKNLWKEPPV